VSKFGRMMMVAGLWALASSASAQVQQGQVRLSIDTELLAFAQLKAEVEDGGSMTEKDLGFGPGALEYGGVLPSPVGFTVGYVAHPHVIPQLAFSFGLSKSSTKYEYDGESEEEDGPSVGSLMFSPRVEVPFNPDSRAVFGALVGLDFRRFRFEQEGDDELGIESYESTLMGFGPTLGLTGHFFVAQPVSVDVSALFTLDKLKQDIEAEGAEEIDFDTYRQFTFGILIGLSAWPGT
jgi:hypothetical protein